MIPHQALHALLASGCIAFLLGVTPARAATTIVDKTVNVSIPDANPTGLVDSINISGSTVLGIQYMEVRLEISGGWNGDIYAYLSHETGFSMLLNRSGRTSVNGIGSGSSGFRVVLRDDALADIHAADGGSGAVIGTFQPSARNADPLAVLDTTPRSLFLNSFYGLNANGEWRLFLADIEPGDESTLVSWGLTVQGVPEPSKAMLLFFGMASALFSRRRWN